MQPGAVHFARSPNPASVRDSASPLLRDARRLSSDLGGQLQKRLGRYLNDEDVSGALSDSYVTVRNDRYVLPVRADARGKVTKALTP